MIVFRFQSLPGCDGLLDFRAVATANTILSGAFQALPGSDDLLDAAVPPEPVDVEDVSSPSRV